MSVMLCIPAAAEALAGSSLTIRGAWYDFCSAAVVRSDTVGVLRPRPVTAYRHDLYEIAFALGGSGQQENTRSYAMATEYPISEEQVRFYEENGYIQLLGVLTSQELEQVPTALDEVMAAPLDQHHDLSRGRPDYERIFVQ